MAHFDVGDGDIDVDGDDGDGDAFEAMAHFNVDDGDIEVNGDDNDDDAFVAMASHDGARENSICWDGANEASISLSFLSFYAQAYHTHE